MSRKRIPRSLPPLEKAFQNFPGFTEESNKQRILLDELRKAAKRLRKKKSQPFYSMREIAVFFKAPLRTVAIAYETLEGEGLFNLVRSSQTLLVGKTESTQQLVRGVVGIPISLLSLVVSPCTRALHLQLEEHLRKKGFVADFIFLRSGEDCEPDFVERLLRHNLDFVIWHSPHSLSSQVILSVLDHAIRLITIQHTEAQMSQVRPTYLMNWEPAYRKMAETWLEAGLSRALVPKPIFGPSLKALPNFIKIMNTAGIEIRLMDANMRALLDKVGKQGDSTAVAFMDQQGADSLCNEEPAILEQLLKICRVAFCRGPISLPYFQHRPAFADIIGFSPSEAAERISEDLCQPPPDQSAVPHHFKAIYHPRAALNGAPESL